MDFFENHATVAMKIDKSTFYACKIIKVTSGFNLKIFFSLCDTNIKKTAENFSNTNNSTTLMPPGVSREAKLSIEFEFLVWCNKIGTKTKKLQKTVKKSSFFGVFLVISSHFWSFLFFLGFWLNFSAPNYQIQTQWIILLL